MLSRLDRLFVVHVVKEGKKEKDKDRGDKWCVGGPLLPPMRVALAKFPHQVIELEVRLLSKAQSSSACVHGNELHLIKIAMACCRSAVLPF